MCRHPFGWQLLNRHFVSLIFVYLTQESAERSRSEEETSTSGRRDAPPARPVAPHSESESPLEVEVLDAEEASAVRSRMDPQEAAPAGPATSAEPLDHEYVALASLPMSHEILCVSTTKQETSFIQVYVCLVCAYTLESQVGEAQAAPRRDRPPLACPPGNAQVRPQPRGHHPALLRNHRRDDDPGADATAERSAGVSGDGRGARNGPSLTAARGEHFCVNSSISYAARLFPHPQSFHPSSYSTSKPYTFVSYIGVCNDRPRCSGSSPLRPFASSTKCSPSSCEGRTARKTPR